MTYCAALLGGSFDPVHHGHVALAALFARLLHPDELRVIPAGSPWQKAGGLQASAAHRVAMLELACAQAGLDIVIDLQEVRRTSATYTVDTLRNVRQELGPDASIVFLMGADQLRQLDSWRDWRDLFGLAHFAVAARPGYSLAALPAPVQTEVAARLGAADELRATPHGRVLLAPELAENVSATQIRAALAQRQPNSLISGVVLDYIQQHQLYKN